jgi:hypothetical protein
MTFVGRVPDYGIPQVANSTNPIALGHVSIQTTVRYLGRKQKLSFAVNGKLGPSKA